MEQELATTPVTNTEAVATTTERHVEVFEMEEPSTSKEILYAVIKAYQDAYNKANPDSETEYNVTITTHKVPTKEGNKDVAYLRLVRSTRLKGVKSIPNIDETKPDIQESHPWENFLINQETHVFKNMQEQANPAAHWREQLYMNAVARLMAAGLEYAEILKKYKQMKDKPDPKPKSDLIITDQMPKALTPDEERYKAEVAKMRAKN